MITLDDVAGLEAQKSLLKDTLLLPLQKKELYFALVKAPDKVREQKNFLFTGPPGSGKTYLAEALAGELDLPFTFLQSTQVLDEYVGRGAKLLRSTYEKQGGIIFIDEIDAIGKKRSLQQSTTQDLLVQLLFCLGTTVKQKPYATIATTNKPEVLDEALLSRFTHTVPFFHPDALQRKEIIQKNLGYYTHKITSVDMLVQQTEQHDARQLTSLFSSAVISALKQERPYLLEKDFLKVISYV